jgi:hypothetical protein
MTDTGREVIPLATNVFFVPLRSGDLRKRRRRLWFVRSDDVDLFGGLAGSDL